MLYKSARCFSVPFAIASFTMALSLPAAANPHVGVGFQLDHVSFVQDKGSNDANMVMGFVSIAPIQWLALEMRVALNLGDVLDEFKHGTPIGRTRMALQAGGFLRANLPLGDDIRLYALAGRNYSMVKTGTCEGYRFHYENEFGQTYYSDCGTLYDSYNGPVYGAGIRIGSVRKGWINVEATQMPRRHSGFGFDTIGIGFGMGF